jgi:hypothetical protein
VAEILCPHATPIHFVRTVFMFYERTQFGSGPYGPTGAFTHLKFRSGVRAYAGVFSLVFSVGQYNIKNIIISKILFLMSVA